MCLSPGFPGKQSLRHRYVPTDTQVLRVRALLGIGVKTQNSLRNAGKMNNVSAGFSLFSCLPFVNS